MFYVRGLDGHRAVMRIALWAVALLATLPAGAQPAAQEYAFALPAQPLEQALEQFSVDSGWSVMYQAELARGRRSAPAFGRMPPWQALQRLLEGTGVSAEVSGPQRAVLHPGVAAPTPPSAHLQGQLQARLRTLFCDDAAIAPGDYAARLQFRVDARGQVQAVQLQQSSGDARRDARLLQVLAALSLPEAAGRSEPLVLQIQPTSGRPQQDCGQP